MGSFPETLIDPKELSPEGKVKNGEFLPNKRSVEV